MKKWNFPAARARRAFFYFSVLFFILLVLCSCAHTGRQINIDTRLVYMQTFVKDISSYARSLKENFIVIPQNGIELAFNNGDPADGVMASYIEAIDGIGLEELFYNGRLSVDNERLQMARTLKDSVKIIVADYVSDNANLPDSAGRSGREGFISFQRQADNYDYKFIPETISSENENDIFNLADAKNFLYLTGSGNYSGKDEIIEAIESTNYDVVLVDLFSYDNTFTKNEIERLKKKVNGKKRLVISYISIGSAENYRYYWKDGWKKGSPSWLKKNYEGYPDELWVEFWNPEWQKIIFGGGDSYISKIINAGFDGVYLDNVEAYYFLDK